jgi:hypothetical protein
MHASPRAGNAISVFASHHPEAWNSAASFFSALLPKAALLPRRDEACGSFDKGAGGALGRSPSVSVASDSLNLPVVRQHAAERS